MPIDEHLLQKIKADKTLTELNLSNQALAKNDIQILIEGLSQNQALTSLNIHSNRISQDVQQQLEKT